MELRYRRSARAICPHGQRGTVVRVARGPGPINAEVRLESGRHVVTPRRGNLFKVQE